MSEHAHHQSKVVHSLCEIYAYIYIYMRTQRRCICLLPRPHFTRRYTPDMTSVHKKKLKVVAT